MLYPRLLLIACLCHAASAWDYQSNGKDWAERRIGLCAGVGEHSAQSPIDLPADAPFAEARKLFWKYPALRLEVPLYNNGRSLAMTLPEAYKAGFGFVPNAADLLGSDSAVFRLWQVSFHSPSEHTLAGRRMPLEMQMVHQRVTGGRELAVLSVFFEESPGLQLPFLTSFLEHANGSLPVRPWDETTVSFASPAKTDIEDPRGFGSVLSGSTYYAYEGSLTVPPCETSVKHFVRRDPILAPAAQIRAFTTVLLETCPPQGNFREQPLYSTASNAVVVVGSVDTLGGLAASAATASSHSENARVSGPEAEKMIADHPRLRELSAYDSEALKHAKGHYQQADLNLRAALSSSVAAKRGRQGARDDFRTATGPMRAIGVKWTAVEAQGLVVAAERQVQLARAALSEAAAALVRIYRQELGGNRDLPSAGIAKVRTTTAAPSERGSDGAPVTTLVPFTAGLGSWGEQRAMQEQKSAASAAASEAVMPISYPDEVALPSGLAASPFTDQAQTRATISAGLSRQGVSGPMPGTFRLQPNLRQLDSMAGVAADAPQLTENAEHNELERPKPLSLRLRLPIARKSIASESQFRGRLRAAIAADLDIPEASVQVFAPRDAVFSMGTPVPPPMLG